ncbi:MAG: IS3 family transposase [Gammaproteobacteria bacterium]|nr:IS3 family transposase [Gammaproteobacteria bacterium]
MRSIAARGESYGSPSTHAELADDHDIRVGKKRVARLMRAVGLKGLQPWAFVATTVTDPVADHALDKAARQSKAEGPDRLWVADITYIPTGSGFLYLAVVLDVWSRRIVRNTEIPKPGSDPRLRLRSPAPIPPQRRSDGVLIAPNPSSSHRRGHKATSRTGTLRRDGSGRRARQRFPSSPGSATCPAGHRPARRGGCRRARTAGTSRLAVSPRRGSARGADGCVSCRQRSFR